MGILVLHCSCPKGDHSYGQGNCQLTGRMFYPPRVGVVTACEMTPSDAVFGSAVSPPAEEERIDRQATEIILVTRSDIPRVTSWPASAHGTEHEESTEAKDATLAFLPSSPNSCLSSPGYLQQRSHTPCLFLSRLHGHTSIATKTKT